MRKAALIMMVCTIIVPVLAATCSYEFIGQITHITSPNPFPSIAVNQPFAGTFSYDLMPYSATGTYNQTASLAFATGTFQFSHSGTTQIIVVDYPATNAYLGKSDSFTFDASGTQPTYSYFRTGIYLQDNTRTALTSVVIPELLSFSAFDIAQLRFTGMKAGSSFSYTGQITQLQLIPEPATLLMLLSALPFFRRKTDNR